MPLPVPNVRIYGAESPQFVDYGRSSAIRQESVPITATHRRLRAGVTVAPGSSGDDSMAALFPTFNLHRRETVNPLTLIENPDAVQRDLLEACVHVVESPNFVVFHDAVGDDIDNVIFPDLIALEAFFIVLQLEYGFDFTLPCLSYPPTLPPDHGYRKQLWHERRFPIFLRHGGDPGGGGWADIFFVVSRWACPVPAAAAATAMEAAVMTIFSMISLFFFHVQRTLPYWQFDADGKPRELPEHQRAEILHDATVKLAAIIVLQMLSTSRDAGVPPWVPKADSAPGTALAGVRNNMTRNFHKAWATHDKWVRQQCTVCRTCAVGLVQTAGAEGFEPPRYQKCPIQ